MIKITVNGENNFMYYAGKITNIIFMKIATMI